MLIDLKHYGLLTSFGHQFRITIKGELATPPLSWQARCVKWMMGRLISDEHDYRFEIMKYNVWTLILRKGWKCCN